MYIKYICIYKFCVIIIRLLKILIMYNTSSDQSHFHQFCPIAKTSVQYLSFLISNEITSCSQSFLIVLVMFSEWRNNSKFVSNEWNQRIFPRN